MVVCRIAMVLFGLAYLFAVFVFLTGTFGWFGQETDPLSAVFLVPLGLPWVLIGVPDPFGPVVGLGAPLLNLFLIWLLCRWLSRRHGHGMSADE